MHLYIGSVLREISVVRWPFVGAFKVVAAHDLSESVRMRQHVGNGLFVLAGRLVSHNVSCQTANFSNQ